MSFVSLSFIAYISVVILLYFIVPKRIQWVVLLVSSYVFFFINSKWLVFLLFFETLITFLTGIALERIRLGNEQKIISLKEALSKEEKKKIQSKGKKDQKKVLAAGIILILGILVCLKYHGFFMRPVNGLAMHMGLSIPQFKLLVPIGISFYSLQAISYMVDVFRNRIKADRSLLRFMLFMSYFPQIVQGPIPRYKQLAGQLYESHNFDYERACFGAQLILWGFMKKMILADRIAIPVSMIFDNPLNYKGPMILLAAVGYGFQVYADFSGGMDIASGFSQIIGIDLEQNFRQPYFSESVEEFWRRWHITLGAFMREYVFYPLSLSKTFTRIGRSLRGIFGPETGKKIPPLLATFIVYFLVGFWHGADWKYVWYGIWNGVFIASGILFKNQYESTKIKLKINDQLFSWKLFRILRTFTIVSIGRIISRASDTATAVIMIKQMMKNLYYWSYLTNGALLKLGLDTVDWLILLVSIVILLLVDYAHEKGISVRRWVSQQGNIFRTLVYVGAMIIVVLLGVYGPGYSSAAFIYQQF
ncbi:MAG: MBOAT family protein [Solobacterium sp.]|nr:MBOAT family protein [Solobacterium sp.]